MYNGVSPHYSPTQKKVILAISTPSGQMKSDVFVELLITLIALKGTTRPLPAVKIWKINYGSFYFYLSIAMLASGFTNGITLNQRVFLLYKLHH